MIRVLKFEGNNLEHAQYYAMLYQAIAQRGKTDSTLPKELATEELHTEARLVKAFKSIGTPVGELAVFTEGEPPPTDVRFRVLRKGGGEIRIQQKPDFTKLTKFVEDLIYSAALSDVKADLESFLDTAKKEEDDK